MVQMNQRQALALARESKEGVTDDLISALSAGPCIAMELIARESVAAFKNLVSMRAWVTGVRCSSSPVEANRELAFFFGEGGAALSVRPQLRDTTLCLVKPHTLREGKAGRVIRGSRPLIGRGKRKILYFQVQFFAQCSNNIHIKVNQ